MKHIVCLVLLAGFVTTAWAQRVLNLDSCRAMALRNNKQMGTARLKQQVAANLRQSARTQYLPRINAVGAYMFTSREISILSDGQKSALGNIGTTATAGIGSATQDFASGLSADQKTEINRQLGAFGTDLDQVMSGFSDNLSAAAGSLNAVGQSIVDAFRTDTRNIFAGSIMLTQPLYMGGSIVAMNRLADLGEQLAEDGEGKQRQATLYETDCAYWQVVSLRHKKRLAESYLGLVKRLQGDVRKMIAEGVATRADGLSVDVKVNEAEMTLLQVDNGLSLSRMLLCQLCGLPIGEDVSLADEDSEDIAAGVTLAGAGMETAEANRPELKMLQTTVDMSREAVNLLKSGNLPKVALTGGYSISNPNVFNGYRNSFGGVWNVGVLVSIPVWNWGDVTYKVRAAKGATAIARLEMEEAREKIELQVNQCSYKLTEAARRLTMARTNIGRAEENLRCAELGYKEDVMPVTTVMEAQTAWLQARSQEIDAEIDVRLSRTNLDKALGTLE